MTGERGLMGIKNKYGEEFDKQYIEYEKEKKYRKVLLKASNCWVTKNKPTKPKR